MPEFVLPTLSGLATLSDSVRPTVLRRGTRCRRIDNRNFGVVNSSNDVERVFYCHGSAIRSGEVSDPLTTTRFPGQAATPDFEEAYAFWLPYVTAAASSAPRWIITAGAERQRYEQPRGCFNWNATGITAGKPSDYTGRLILGLGRRGSVRVAANMQPVAVPKYEVATYRAYSTMSEGASAHARLWAHNWSVVSAELPAGASAQQQVSRALARWSGSARTGSEPDVRSALRRAGVG